MIQQVQVSSYDFDQLLESVTRRVESRAYDVSFCVGLCTQALALHAGMNCGLSTEQLEKVVLTLNKALEAPK